MEPTVSLKEYVDKADAFVLAKMETTLKGISDKIDDLPTSSALFWSCCVTGIAIIGLLVAIQAFAYSRYDNGVAASGVFAERVLITKERLDDLSAKMDKIIAYQAQTSTQQTTGTTHP